MENCLGGQVTTGSCGQSSRGVTGGGCGHGDRGAGQGAAVSLWSCDFEWRPLIGRNFLTADLAYLSHSKTILPLVKF